MYERRTFPSTRSDIVAKYQCEGISKWLNLFSSKLTSNHSLTVCLLVNRAKVYVSKSLFSYI